jgi:hypothetical protein
MRDETPTSETGLPQYHTGGKRVAGQRQRTKVWEALIVATGLVLSGALYPLPAIAPLLELSPPKYETSDFPALVRSAVANRRIAEASGQSSNLSDLVEVIDNDVLVLRTDTLLELVNTRGLPDSARSLELLRSFQSLTQGHPLALSGGGGGATVNVTSTTLPELLTLLELLLEAMPTSANHQLAAVLTELLPLLAQSLGLAGPPGVAPLDTKVFTQDETPMPPALPQPTVAPTVSPGTVTPAPSKPADAPPPEPAPVPPSVPSSVPSPTPTEAPLPAQLPQVQTPATSVTPQPEPVETPTPSPTSEPTSAPSSTAPEDDPGSTDVTEPEDDRESTPSSTSEPDDDDKEPASEPPKSSDDSPSEPKDNPGNEGSTPGS